MAKPTQEQLAKINQLAAEELTEDQVYVFRSLSADTLPVQRYGWFGEYAIHMNRNMLMALKKDYQTGVGLLASHNSNRLPFGRTFDATIETDEVDGNAVDTLYIDHYIVKYLEGEDGEKTPLRTEVNGMTTQDIVNHIRAGHTFDTSIGFSITDCQCSICGNDLRNYQECDHYPGEHYDVQVGDRTEKRRCDMIANSGEGLENSIVYAGAVNRALIQREQQNSYSQQTDNGQGAVKANDAQTYDVDDIKKVPLSTEVFCRFSKNGGIELFTNTPGRQEIAEGTNMGNENTQQTQITAAEPLKHAYSEEQYNAVLEEKNGLATKLAVATSELEKAQADIEAYKVENETLKEKATLADEYRSDLITETLAAGVKARGNAFSEERYGKYLETLSVADLKAEREAFQNEFSQGIEDARATKQELEDKTDDKVEMSYAEKLDLAAKNAMEIFRANGNQGNLEELTKQELAKLSK